jgi:hypothetical protein
MGIFNYGFPGNLSFPNNNIYQLIVTNVAVYILIPTPPVFATNLPLGQLLNIHTWSSPSEINLSLTTPGKCVSFVEVNNVVYFTGIMLNGIFSVASSAPFVFSQATNYVCGQYITELSGRIIVAQCRFPTGGGTGNNILPTVAWSGLNTFSGSGASDPWNPANNVPPGAAGGFNQLTDVPDQITGLAGMGRSGIIVRKNGLSQMDPNSGSNAGVQPFNFYHLWASPQGSGGFEGSVAQFGYMLFMLSSDNVYTVNLAAGPQPIGQRIIKRINADRKFVGNQAGVTNLASTTGTPFWYFANTAEVDGQLHYYLTFSSYYLTNGTTQNYQAFVYDYNVADGTWHVWDMSQYRTSGGVSPNIIGFSCPMSDGSVNSYGGGYAPAPALAYFSGLRYFMAGTFYSYGLISSYQPSGYIYRLVHWDYNFSSKPINTFNAATYTAFAMPFTTVVFRGEILSLGHKIVNRRLRIQADNAPVPLTTLTAATQQQAQVVARGALQPNVSTSQVNWTFGSGPGSTVPYMQGNFVPTGQAMQTYYADVVCSDEMVQMTLSTYVNDPNNPWNSMPAFRISSVSLIADDPKGATQ